MCVVHDVLTAEGSYPRASSGLNAVSSYKVVQEPRHGRAIAMVLPYHLSVGVGCFGEVARG